MKIDLAPNERTLPALLKRQAEAFGERPLVTIAGGEWVHRDAPGLAARRAGALQAAGVGKGDRVALMCSNRVEFLEAFLGCGWIGAASVPVNSASMGPQIEYLLTNSGARLLVIEHQYLERLATADLSRTALQAIWVVGGASPHSAGGVACSPWPAAGQPADAEAVQPGDTLAILYTSGTTGPAKGVMCPHAQYYWWGVNSARILGIEADDVLCTTLPLFHVNALNTFAQAAVTGARVVFEGKFSASGFWPAMRRHEATVVYLLGAMVPILLAQPVGEAERGHRVRVGLGPGVPAAAGEEFHARTGVTLLEGYGSTETNFVIATAGGTRATSGGGTMGWLQPGFDARVVDEHDVALPAGVAGELVLRADEPFAFGTGYFGMPEKTVEAWRNLWFHTGDRVVQGADGSFRFIDRIKDAIRRRGENISSYEVEQVLLAHPSVAEAAVYPVRSELAEDDVMAALVARPGAQLDAAELWRFCETRLPYFAVPRYVDVVAELPRTENGKVQKYKLREQGVTATARDRTHSLTPTLPPSGEGGTAPSPSRRGLV
jgi:carnitine-CoA ligase